MEKEGWYGRREDWIKRKVVRRVRTEDYLR
jgi:hypothetical protein